MQNPPFEVKVKPLRLLTCLDEVKEWVDVPRKATFCVIEKCLTPCTTELH